MVVNVVLTILLPEDAAVEVMAMGVMDVFKPGGIGWFKLG